ncbi:MAG: hypothetical protein IKW95_06655 [Lachnospiraceae bacterium]|nr:hypothetical protein [Lachnospiraceae bacterium]
MDYYRLENNREEICELLKERRKLLKGLLRDMEKNYWEHPGGMIRTSQCKKTNQYYWREKAGERWKYLPKKQRKIAEQIVNSEYQSELKQQIETELKETERWLQKGIPGSMEALFERMSDARRNLVHRMIMSEEEFVQSFLAEEYESSHVFEENKQYKTTQGEYVRSKAEWMIAERLFHFGIPYQYEFPIVLKGYGNVRPDFRCLNVRRREVILWEHQGKMGDELYAGAAIRKIQAYEENGFLAGKNLILTEESSDSPLIPKVVDRWIDRMLV